MINSTEKQLVQFDVDISGDNMQTIIDLEVDMSVETIEKAFRELMMIPSEIKCEIINRSRPTKLSYHIRFACNSDATTIKHLLISTKVKYVLLPHIDVNIYTNSLRMTQTSSEFLYNPDNMSYVSGTMSKKLVD